MSNLSRTIARRSWAVLIFAGVLSGCGMFGPLIQTGEPSVFRNPSVPAIKYDAIAVIGADDTSPTLRMSVMVREKLKEEGVQGVRRAGRWTTEEDALSGLCSSEEEPRIQGVVFVSYDTLILRECAKKEVAFRVQSNGRWTITQLAQELAKYVKTMAEVAEQTQ